MAGSVMREVMLGALKWFKTLFAKFLFLVQAQYGKISEDRRIFFVAQGAPKHFRNNYRISNLATGVARVGDNVVLVKEQNHLAFGRFKVK